jgi:hypothetical protein
MSTQLLLHRSAGEQRSKGEALGSGCLNIAAIVQSSPGCQDLDVFFMPGGRLRLPGGASCVAATIHFGGRPRLFWPTANRSRLMIASVI